MRLWPKALPRLWVVPSNLTWPSVIGLHGRGSRYGIGPAYGTLREAATFTEKLRQLNGAVVILPTGQFWVLFLRQDPRPVIIGTNEPPEQPPVQEEHWHDHSALRLHDQIIRTMEDPDAFGRPSE